MDDGPPAGPPGASHRFHPVVIDDRHRFEIAVDPDADDGISGEYRAGVYPGEFRALLGLLWASARHGGRVLDLGAHIGSFALGASALGFEVAAVEASPRNAALLRASLAKNDFDRARVVEAAVSDRPGTITFCDYGPFGLIVPQGDGPYQVTVRALTTDQILDELAWDRVDFVKMDVEGSELAALRGMAHRLSGPSAPPIVYESNGHTLHLFGATPNDLKAALERLGYRNYLVDPAGRLVPVSADELQPETVVDYLATRSDRPELPGWTVSPPRTPAEIAAAIIATAGAKNPQERWYIARASASAPAEIVRMPEVARALAALRRDRVPRVRDAARSRDRGRWWPRRLPRSA